MEKQMKIFETKSRLTLSELLEVMVDNSRSVKNHRIDIFRNISDITQLYWCNEEINFTWILDNSETYLLSKDDKDYDVELENILANHNKLKIYTIAYNEYSWFIITREKNHINRRNDNDTKRYIHY